MEEPITFDNNLESFFSQLANPFVDQEIVASQMFPLYKEGDTKKEKEGKHLKRPLPESESPSSGDEKGEDQAAKQKNRRVNQNIASRNYRNRKKEYVNSLESKVSQLSTENEDLKKEISFLKRVDNFDSMRPDPSLIAMVVELRQIMGSIADAIKKNADDSTISYLLQLFHLVVEKRHHIFEKEVEKLVNPFAQAKLAVLGYTPVLEYPAVANVISPNDDGWWNQYSAEAKISPAQMQKLHMMREELWKIDQELRQERVALDASIKDFYLHKMRVIPNFPALADPEGKENQNPSVDVSDAVEFSRKMNALKNNFVTQRNLLINAFSRLGQLLTPRQQAQLLLKLQIQTRFDSVNMELLKNVWESVTSNEAPMISLLSMIPAKGESIVPPQTHMTNSPSLSSSPASHTHSPSSHTHSPSSHTHSPSSHTHSPSSHTHSPTPSTLSPGLSAASLASAYSSPSAAAAALLRTTPTHPLLPPNYAPLSSLNSPPIRDGRHPLSALHLYPNQQQ